MLGTLSTSLWCTCDVPAWYATPCPQCETLCPVFVLTIMKTFTLTLFKLHSFVFGLRTLLSDRSPSIVLTHLLWCPAFLPAVQWPLPLTICYFVMAIWPISIASPLILFWSTRHDFHALIMTLHISSHDIHFVSFHNTLGFVALADTFSHSSSAHHRWGYLKTVFTTVQTKLDITGFSSTWSAFTISLLVKIEESIISWYASRSRFAHPPPFKPYAVLYNNPYLLGGLQWVLSQNFPHRH